MACAGAVPQASAPTLLLLPALLQLSFWLRQSVGLVLAACQLDWGLVVDSYGLLCWAEGWGSQVALAEQGTMVSVLVWATRCCGFLPRGLVARGELSACPPRSWPRA